MQRWVVTAAQMSQIEARVFAAGMPVAALMEKVGGLLSRRIQALYPLGQVRKVGVLVGPGHNGGDALVIARELHLEGYEVRLYQPFSKLKDLTASHAQYAASLGIETVPTVEALKDCEVLIDGLFGFGLTRSLTDSIADTIHELNHWSVRLNRPILSIDLPSGIHTDTGEVLGTAIRATRTFCLGLWKRAFLQDAALSSVGQAELIGFGLPETDITAVLEASPIVQRITPDLLRGTLNRPRHPTTHKYQQGHLLLIAGSRRYMGAAILAGLAARASGVGMLSIAVPESMRSLLIAQLPDALVIGCPEGEAGEIAHWPRAMEWAGYDAIACGCGLSPEAQTLVEQVLETNLPLILDADGLNILANLGTVERLQRRSAPTILTPHPGEFKRLFPAVELGDRIQAVQQAASLSGAIVLLKGARTAIAHPTGQVWVVPDSTPALARGGSGDVLTGLMGGLLAQGVRQGLVEEAIVCAAAGWHAQAGIAAARVRSEAGVDASTLIQFLIPPPFDFSI
ncbi:MAG: NAD(P)H-hydrate dehydratase [Oculatellaceae cyanobacterium Prado106]|nr:NAD(P)H-hydrate dehydratase [Oculatellaceae cyanobacterium Prado106]